METKAIAIGMLSVGFVILGCGSVGVAAVGEPVTVGTTVKEPPAWAAAQVELAKASNAFAERVLERFVDPNTGKPTCKFNVGQADDVVEGVSTWDRFALLFGSDKVRGGMVGLWQHVYGVTVERGQFVDGFYRYPYDAEHIGELYQMLWACMELDPFNKTLADQNRQITDVVIDRCYNPKARLIKHAWLGAEGGAYWTNRNIKRANPPIDELINGMFIMNAFRAYMTTGDEKYRKWALEYGGKWNELAAANGGMFPFGANSQTGKANEPWWSGATKWNYKRWGFLVPARWLHGWPVAMMLMDRGNVKHLSGLSSSASALFAAGTDGLPAGFYTGAEWERTGKLSDLGGARPYLGWMVKLIDRPYSMAFDDATARQIKRYYAASLGDKATGSEQKFLRPLMFIYFDAFDLDWAAEQFRQSTLNVQRRHQRVEKAKAPSKGDHLTVLAQYRPHSMTMIDGSFYGSDNGRAGCPSTAPVGYWRNGRSRGLPGGVAALVRHVGPDGVDIYLTNTTDSAQTMHLVGGFYGTHRIEKVTVIDSSDADRSNPRSTHKVARRSMRLSLRANSVAQLKVTMTRFTYGPTLTPIAAPPNGK